MMPKHLHERGTPANEWFGIKERQHDKFNGR